MFYIYENWQADGHKAKIHRADCSFCNHGKGFHGTDNTSHGQWHGPFASYSASSKAASETGSKVFDCKHCTPQSE